MSAGSGRAYRAPQDSGSWILEGLNLLITKGGKKKMERRGQV